MIDFSNEIFTQIFNEIKEVHGEKVKVIGEYVKVPDKFPCVTVDETHNIPYEMDSGVEKYSAITYRVQVFSNKKAGKRAEARAIYKTVSDKLFDMNLIAKTYRTTPDMYNSNIYEIQGTFEGAIDRNGVIHRR